MTKITVYKTQISGCYGPIVYTDAQEAAAEISIMLSEQLDIGDIITITVSEMEKSEFDALEEFGGY